MSDTTKEKLTIKDVIERLDALQFRAFDLNEDGTKSEWVYGKYLDHDDVRELVNELKYGKDE